MLRSVDRLLLSKDLLASSLGLGRIQHLCRSEPYWQARSLPLLRSPSSCELSTDASVTVRRNAPLCGHRRSTRGDQTELSPTPPLSSAGCRPVTEFTCRLSGEGPPCHRTPPLSGARGLCHDETDSRREVVGQRGPGAGEGPWYHAAPPHLGWNHAPAASPDRSRQRPRASVTHAGALTGSAERALLALDGPAVCWALYRRGGRWSRLEASADRGRPTGDTANDNRNRFTGETRQHQERPRYPEGSACVRFPESTDECGCLFQAWSGVHVGTSGMHPT